MADSAMMILEKIRPHRLRVTRPHRLRVNFPLPLRVLHPLPPTANPPARTNPPPRMVVTYLFADVADCRARSSTSVLPDTPA